ncbi:MAG: BMP family ABC transporter substrate-binding protein [Solobacterium sp.]|jgi:basic membrane protein A|nr:BMP family ABC transporter substrate-binding protein [Solobacterium sp.]
MNNNYLKKFATSLCAVAMLAGCGGSASSSTTASPAASAGTSSAAAFQESASSSIQPLNIMFVVTGNLGGGTNNDDVNSALQDYTSKYGGSVNTYECNMDTSVYETTLKQAAETGNYDLIVTGFGTMAEPLANTAAMYPDQKFLIFDTSMDYSDGKNSNVISVQVLQNQGAFLAGALAALMTTSDAELSNADKVVGFVGAMESTAIQDCLIGYIEGVNYIDPSTEVLYSFVGSHTDSALTKEMALTQNQNGADIIYGVSQSDLAVADAALDNNFYAICSDADDATSIAATSPDTANHIVTSVIKNYYSMVYPVLEEIGSGTAQFGTHSSISYADGGVSLAQNEYFDNAVPDDVKTAFQAVVDDMTAGKIEVDTAYGATTEEIAEIESKAAAQ